MDTVGDVFLVLGSALAMIGGIGVVRFGDVFARMHAAAKAPTLALILVAIGAALRIGTLLAATTLMLVVVLALLSSPVGAHAVSRSSRRQMTIDIDDVDELTADEQSES